MRRGPAALCPNSNARSSLPNDDNHHYNLPNDNNHHYSWPNDNNHHDSLPNDNNHHYSLPNDNNHHRYSELIPALNRNHGAYGEGPGGCLPNPDFA